MLRFKADDGSDFPKWEEKRLGDIVSFINGRAYSQDELLSAGKYQVLRVGNLFTNDTYYYSNMELEPDKYIEGGNLTLLGEERKKQSSIFHSTFCYMEHCSTRSL